MVKNLIFDFGAVLIPISEAKSEEAFAELGARESLAGQKKLFKQIETGAIEPDKFLTSLQPHFFRKKIFKADLAKAWNAICYSAIPEESIIFLKRLRREGYRIFLLSNTNALHIAQIKAHTGLFQYRQFINQFDAVYYSHEVGMSKPDAEIYKKVLKDNDLKPEECFFTDDKKANIKGAAKLGLHTFWYNPEESTLKELKAEIIRLNA